MLADGEPDVEGRLPPVGNTVSQTTGRYENSIGAVELTTVWSDPDLDPALRSFTKTQRHARKL
jgi:hypothetical protein